MLRAHAHAHHERSSYYFLTLRARSGVIYMQPTIPARNPPSSTTPYFILMARASAVLQQPHRESDILPN